MIHKIKLKTLLKTVPEFI